MSGAGDLVEVLSLDDFQFSNGLRQASQETKRFAHESTSAFETFGHGVEHSMHKASRVAEHMAFSLSESGSQGLGHGLAHMLGVLPMVTGAFGPMGFAMGAAAAVVGSALIPQLMAAEEHYKSLAESIRETLAEQDRFSARNAKGMAFEAKLDKTDTAASAKVALDELGLEEQQLQDKKDRLETQAKRLRDSLVAQGVAKPLEGNDKFQGLPGQLRSLHVNTAPGHETFTDRARGSLGMHAGEETIKEREEALKEAQKLAVELENARDRMEDIQKEKEQMGEKLESNKEIEGSAAGFDEALKHQKRLEQAENQRLRISNDIAKSIETPFEKAENRLEFLKEAFTKGFIDEDLFERASDDAIDDFKKASQEHHEGRLAGGHEEGSSAAISAINRAQARDRDEKNDPAKKQVTLLTQQKRLSEDQLKEQSAIRKKIEKERFVVVHLGGG